MIQTLNLTKRYGDLTALSNLNLTIEQGQCFGFIGPNGAGKTTTIKILATLLKPSWGEARVDGLSVGPVNARAVRRIIGYVPDFFGAYEDLVCREYLEFFAASYGIDGDARQRAIGDVLALTDLTHKQDAEVNSLSRGMQQRLSVARVLLHDPKVLLMDEPASGLDPRARIEMRELLKELHRLGKTILISSHILLELSELCDVVGIIEQGELKFHGSVDELLRRVQAGRELRVRVRGRAGDAAVLLERLPGVETVQPDPADGLTLRVQLTPDADPDRPPPLASTLVRADIEPLSIEEQKASLESAFMTLTRGLVQ